MIFLSKSSQKESDEYNHFWRCLYAKSLQSVYERVQIEAARLNSRVMQTHFYLGYLSPDEYEKKNVA